MESTQSTPPLGPSVSAICILIDPETKRPYTCLEAKDPLAEVIWYQRLESTNHRWERFDAGEPLLGWSEAEAAAAPEGVAALLCVHYPDLREIPLILAEL